MPGPRVRDRGVGAIELVGAPVGAVVSTTALLGTVVAAPPPWSAAMRARPPTPRTMAAAANGNPRLTVIACDSYRFRPASHSVRRGTGRPPEASKTGRG